MSRSYAIRTYGCQMNEHDSERIAGLLEADGLERADGVESADVIVLNTCCIRENADNKLYGALGQLKSLKDARPGVQIAVAGCLAQKDGELVRQRAGHVDVVFGTHNVHRAAALLRQAADRGPVVEILAETAREDAAAFPSALPVRRDSDHAAWVTIQIGCDNSCAFCIVPAVRGSEMSRPFGEIVAEVQRLAVEGVSEVTLLGQNVNSFGRDLALARRAIGRAGSGAGHGADSLAEEAARHLDAVGPGAGSADGVVPRYGHDLDDAGPGAEFGDRVVPRYGHDLDDAGPGAEFGDGVVPRYGHDLDDAGLGAEFDDEWQCGPAWGADRRARPLFADLLRAVGEIDGIHRVRFTSPHPKDLRTDTMAAMAEVGPVCEHLHLPLQSGSDAVLAAMRRGYTAGAYLDRLARARAAVDDLAVSTDIIVGFPGETEADFEQTLEVTAAARYDSAFTFIFSPRPGTRAAELTDRFVPKSTAADRYRRLRHVVERSSLLANQARVGLIEEAAVEGPSKKDPGVLTGRTRRNTLVHFAPPRPVPVGSYVTVRVTDAGAHHLRGEMLEVVRPARRRPRIPIAAG